MLHRGLTRLIGACLFILSAAQAHAEGPGAAERAQAREIYSQIVGMDTSVEGKRTPEMAAYLAGRFRAAGFPERDIHVLPHGDTASLVVRWRGDGSGGRPILLMAHMDVVTAHRSDWQRDPFTLVEENGYFFGRGTADNKSGVAMLASTFLTLRGEGFRPTRDLIIAFTGDEETVGPRRHPSCASIAISSTRNLR